MTKRDRPAVTTGVLCRAVIIGCLSAAALASANPVTTQPWREVVVSVTDTARTARFFEEIGGFITLDSGALSRSEIDAWGLPSGAQGHYQLLAPKHSPDGRIRLIDFDNSGYQQPMRPGARAWDSGCYFSLMGRVKDIEAIYHDAIAMGWWTETPIAPLQFGDSSLRIVIFKGPDGLQVQSYERLSPPLPAAVGQFERMTRPFNVMQMVADHSAAYQFFSEVLGFDTFYTGPPVTAPQPMVSPIGIPTALTTEVGYQAGIVYPVPGEYGRMEMIQVHGLSGENYRHRCRAPNLGILAVRFPATDLDAIETQLRSSGQPVVRFNTVAWPNDEIVDLLETQSPDGALIQFFDANP